MVEKLHCKFCRRNCFASLPGETPPAMREAFERHQRECEHCLPVQQYGVKVATCPEGQNSDRFHIGYSWREIRTALTILKLVQAVQQLMDTHGERCNCPACTFAQAALWNASEKEEQVASELSM